MRHDDADDGDWDDCRELAVLVGVEGVESVDSQVVSRDSSNQRVNIISLTIKNYETQFN